jgi:hypothetical protein
MLSVRNLMTLDRSLPNLVVSVVPHTNGKANGISNAHLRWPKEICLGKGFLVVAFLGDGDTAYEDFLMPPCDVVNSAECQQETFPRTVEPRSSHDEFFVTDFLCFLKRLRNRLSIQPLTLHHRLTPVTAENLSKVLPIGNCLEPKSNMSQLKDAVALQVFTL